MQPTILTNFGYRKSESRLFKRAFLTSHKMAAINFMSIESVEDRNFQE